MTPFHPPRPASETLPTMYDLPSEDPNDYEDPCPPRPAWETLPTMYDLPSEDPEEPGLPDQFHDFQPHFMRDTCRPDPSLVSEFLTLADLNLYYDVNHPRWYKRPDWMLILGKSAGDRQADLRWSYVMWQEGVAPFLAVELLSPGTEAEDLGQTTQTPGQPPTKWHVYEQILRIPYYAVFDRYENRFRLFRLMPLRYEEVPLPDQRFWFAELGLGLGVWSGSYEGAEGMWLRWYDTDGNWVPTAQEQAQLAEQQAQQERQRAEEERRRAQQERQLAQQADRRANEEYQRAEEERLRAQEEHLRAQEADRRAEEERQRADRMAEYLRSLGVDPNAI